eukprot:403359061
MNLSYHQEHGIQPAFAFPAIKFNPNHHDQSEQQSPQFKWKNLADTLVNKNPHQKVLPIQQMLQLVRNQYDEMSEVMRAFTYGWKINRYGKGESTIKEKIRKIEEARLQKWTTKCLLQNKASSICGDRDSEFLDKRNELNKDLPLRVPFFLIDEDNEEMWAQLTKQSSNPNLLYYLPLNEQQLRYDRLYRKDKRGRKRLTFEEEKRLKEEEEERKRQLEEEENRSVTDSFALDYELPEELKELEREVLQEIMNQEFEEKMKQEKQLEKIKIQNQLLKKKTQLTQKEMLVIKKKEQLEKDQKKTQLHNKIQKFRQSISQTQVSELKDRSFIQQSKFQYKQKHYQLKQEKQNANNPLFRKIYRYRDWKDIYSDNNKNDNNSNTVQFNENRLLDDSCQQLNMSNNLIGEQNFSKEILVNDRDPYQNLATYNGDQISNNIHNLNPITSFQTILHRDRNNNTFSNVYSNFRLQVQQK